jgi:NitT/TauT family transport system substrate-binding protein
MVAGTLSAAVAPLVIAQERGFAQRHGVDIEMFIARSGAEAMAALLSQDAPIGSMSGNAVGNAAASGADLVVLAVNQPRLTYQVMGAGEVRVPSDLRGKRLGVADVGGNSDFAAQYLLDKFGLERSADVVVLSLGSQNERLGGLQAGAVDAAMLNAPFTGTARKLGYNLVFDYAEEDFEVISGGIATSRSYLQRQPEIVRGVVAALVDAIHYFKTDRAGTMAVIGRFLQQDDPDVLEDLYRESAGKALPEKPYPTVQGMTNALAQVVRTNESAARLNPADLVDDRFVRELDTSGYIDALYGR